MVHSVCQRFLRDPGEIEDAFQATFLVLARKASSIRRPEVLSSWLYGVACRIAARARSKVLRRRSVETSVPLLEDCTAVVSREVDHVGPVLDQELMRLPEKYRAPIVLCYLKEQTHDQAAAELRWPVGTVRSRLARGRELLRQRLVRRGYTPASAILLTGPGGMISSFQTSVAQPLIQATVAAASRSLRGAAIEAGPTLMLSSTSVSSVSGSASTLAQGVITTMALTHVKLAAASLTAVGLLAGGLGMSAWALVSPGAGRQAETRAPAASSSEKVATTQTNVDFFKTAVPGQVGYKKAVQGEVEFEKALPREVGPANASTGVEGRLADLERKIDLLLQRLNPPQFDDDAVPSSRLPSPAVVGEHPLSRQASPFVTHVGNQSDPLTQARQQASTTPESSSPGPAFPQPRAVVQPPPSLSAIGEPSQQNQPQLAQGQTPSQEPGRSAIELANVPQLPRTRPDLLESPQPQRTSLKEIEAQIQIARLHFERCKPLYAAASIGKEAYEAPLDQIRLLIARLEGIAEDFADQDSLLKVEMVKKHAELKLVEAQRVKTVQAVAEAKKLEERKMVSQSQVSKAEAEDTAALARIEVQRSELQDAELRMDHVRRRLEMIKRSVDEVLTAVPEIARERQPAPDAGTSLPQRRR
jgi:RNA polymerase sigma factor (sigma-70 family)